MAQEHFKMGSSTSAYVQIKDPASYTANLATTSTHDSGRNQYLSMKNKVVGTVQQYELSWKTLTPTEMSTILSQVVNKEKFMFHYFNIFTGTWADDYFYATNFNMPCKTVKDGVECWDELKFNVIGTEPINTGSM